MADDAADVLWETGLCECCSGGCCICFGTMLGCGSCLLASALSDMDGSSCCFNYCCINCAFSRIYARQAYGITGSPGWDVCIACCPCTCCCSACQVAAHIKFRGKPDTLPEENFSFVVADNGGCPIDRSNSVCMDPCGMVMTGLTASCTSASLGSQVTGLPFWAHFFCSSFYVDHHILRKNFGVPGSDTWSDCVRPCCCRVGVQVLPGLGMCLACCYTIQHLENDRLLIAQAVATGAPRLMLNSEVRIELPSVRVDGSETNDGDGLPMTDNPLPVKTRQPTGSSSSEQDAGAAARRSDW